MLNHDSEGLGTAALATHPFGAAVSTLYEEHRDYVLRVLAWRASWLDHSEREAVLHDAYMVLLVKQRDGVLDLGSMHRSQVRAYLTHTALNKALDEGKRAGRRRSVPLEDFLEADLSQAGMPTEESVTALLDAQRVRDLVDELPERQQRVIKLRFFFDRSPQEIQLLLDITERTYRRLLEEAKRTLANRWAVEQVTDRPQAEAAEVYHAA